MLPGAAGINVRKTARYAGRDCAPLQQAVLDGTPDPIFLKDRECRMVMANPAMLRAIGKRAEQVLGKTNREYVDDPEVGRALLEHDRRVLETGVAESMEETLPGPGGVRIFLSTKSPYRDPEGRTIGIIGVSRDITKRKLAEEALRESERRLRTVLGTVSLVGIMLDRQANITLCNDYLLALTGWKREELLGRNWFEVFIPPEMHEEVNQVFLKIMDVGEFPAHHQHEIVTRAGERRLVEWNGTAIRDLGGQVVGLASIGVDITDRKRAEDKLRESEARLREAQHLAHVGSSVWDVDSDTTIWSEEMYRITGRDPNGPAPTYAERVALYSPESWTRMSEAAQRAMATGKPYELDLDMVRADGTVCRTHASGAAVRDDGGRVVRLQGTLQDITEQKRGEEAIRQSEEALRQSNRKLQQLSRDLLRSQDYERRRIARELHDSTAQLLAALSINLGRLRDSELEPGRRERVLSETIDLAAACSAEIRTITYLLHPPLLEEIGLVHALRAYAQGFNQRTGIQVKIKIPPDFGRIGNERESTLFRIIQEGLANVHKHSGSGLAVIELGRDPREVRLVLQDQGRGFTEAPRRRATGFVHLGVGITGMRERAEQLGGRLEIASGDAGTTLTVTLPMVQSNEETADIVGG
jgi:PAS domain S-box-containing protein